MSNLINKLCERLHRLYLDNEYGNTLFLRRFERVEIIIDKTRIFARLTTEKINYKDMYLITNWHVFTDSANDVQEYDSTRW
jgi:hypothetical protein